MQVMKIQLNNPFTNEDERKFWKKLHRILLKNGGWWNLKQRTVWIDFIYRPKEFVSVYLSIPQKNADKMTALLTPEGRRKSILGNASHYAVDKQELLIPEKSSVCELKLAYENVFSLSTKSPVQLPSTLSLEEGEKVRISFCLQPISANWQQHGSRVVKEKTEKGLIRPKDHLNTGVLSLAFYFIRALLNKFILRDKLMENTTPWVSGETLKKLNDCHFKITVRIVGPQRLLPKLARPFQALQGENKLNIFFLSRKESNTKIREMSKQKLGFRTQADPNTNVLSTRELTAVVPFLTFRGAPQREDACPNFM
jgi:hypothetical protein